MKVYSIEKGSLQSAWANLVGVQYISRFDPISATLRECYPPPGEVTFQWQDPAKTRPDIIWPVGYPPIVREKVRQFCNDMGFSGVEFFPAHPVAAFSRSRTAQPVEDGSELWWVMAPAVRYLLDEGAYCGPDAILCPETGVVVRDGKLALSYPGLILMRDVPYVDIFGIANVDDRGIYCCENIVNQLIKQKFKNMQLREVGYVKGSI